MKRIIATTRTEGFTSTIVEEDGVVTFNGDMDIDADGANGQNGSLAAYRVDNKGSEHLANGGMGIRGGKAVFIASWGPDIAATDAKGNPLVINGVIITKTAYRFPGKPENDPAAYLDSETVPYIVVPPSIIRGVEGVVLGCQAFATYKRKRVAAVVGDVGPRTKVGEGSIALARALGIPHSPRSGGIDASLVQYELMPGQPAVVDGVTYELRRSA